MTITVYHAEECNRPAGPKKVILLIVACAHGLHVHIKLWYQTGATMNLYSVIRSEWDGMFSVLNMGLNFNLTLNLSRIF